jgi:hypothetical protein
MIKWMLLAIAGLVALGGVTAAVGYVLPKGHRASRTMTYAVAPEALFNTIADVRR